jgi:DNA-binding transcriptional MerR regulator
MLIGEVARHTGVTIETVRYYEREGLIPFAVRSARGARRFPPDAVARVRFVKQAQAAGLTLGDIKQLVGLQRGRHRVACERMRRVLADRLNDLDARARELQVFRIVLEQHLEACDRALKSPSEPRCPSLDALEHGSEPATPERVTTG